MLDMHARELTKVLPTIRLYETVSAPLPRRQLLELLAVEGDETLTPSIFLLRDTLIKPALGTWGHLCTVTSERAHRRAFSFEVMDVRCYLFDLLQKTMSQY